jgi:hypothetical protein
MSTDRTPPMLKLLLDKPGKYLLYGNGTGIAIEIDAYGNVFQLHRETRERDGTLDETGWSTNGATQNCSIRLLEEQPHD